MVKVLYETWTVRQFGSINAVQFFDSTRKISLKIRHPTYCPLPYLLVKVLPVTERRKLERFKLRVPGTIELVGKDQYAEKKTFYLLTRDICAGGAFFNTTNPIPEDTPVKVGLVLKNERLRAVSDRGVHIKVRGTVLRSEPTGMAVSFGKSYKMTPVSTA